MVTLDQNGDLMPDNYDSTIGYTETVDVPIYHKYILEVEEQGHWEIEETDAKTGGSILVWIIDIPASGYWETRYMKNDELVAYYEFEVPDDAPKELVIEDYWRYRQFIPFSDEEVAENKRRSKVTELKQNLNDTDYVVVKMSESSVTGVPLSEEDSSRYADIIEQRRQWREEINKLESEVNLCQVTP